MVAKNSYSEAAVEAAMKVMVELYRVLGDYAKHVVVIGGWVPRLTIPQDGEQHVGSVDIDLALDNRYLKKMGYQSIQKILLENGYSELDRSFSYNKAVEVDGREFKVDVDLLSGEYDGGDIGERFHTMQEVLTMRLRGTDLAFGIQKEIPMRGTLPNGALADVNIRVAGIVAFLVLKGNALAGRRKEKDAYDIFYCIKWFPGGLDALVAEFEPWVDNKLVREGLEHIAKFFATVDHDGPQMIADFEALDNPEAIEQVKRDCYEQISEFLERLDMKVPA